MKARALAWAGVAVATGLAVWRQVGHGTRTGADGTGRQAGGTAITRIPSQPPLYAYRIAGRLTSADVEAMATELGAAFDRGETVDILIEMPGYEGADLGALFNPLQMVAQVRSLSHVRRYAVLAPPAWAGAMITLSDAVLPVDARVFGVAQMAEAWAWVSAPQEGGRPDGQAGSGPSLQAGQGPAPATDAVMPAPAQVEAEAASRSV